jgi:hypothetical protein
MKNPGCRYNRGFLYCASGKGILSALAVRDDDQNRDPAYGDEIKCKTRPCGDDPIIFEYLLSFDSPSAMRSQPNRLWR